MAADKRARDAVAAAAAARARKKPRAFLADGVRPNAPTTGFQAVGARSATRDPSPAPLSSIRPGVKRKERALDTTLRGRPVADARPKSGKSRPTTGVNVSASKGGGSAETASASSNAALKGSHLPPPTDVAAVLGSRLLDPSRAGQRATPTASTPSYITDSKEIAATEFWQSRNSVVLRAMADLDKLEERIRLLI